MMKTATPLAIKEAANLINAGKLVAFPTETVYGLGADATNGEAVARIFEAKGRPNFNPLIVHVADTREAYKYAELGETAQILMNKYWPGPLTLIVPKKEGSPISELCTAGLDTIALRFPVHPVARDLLIKSGKPIAAPSANTSGKLSPTSPRHVAACLGDKVDMILAGGAAQAGLESTVIDISSGTPVILRPGVITAEEISHTLALDVGYVNKTHDGKGKGPQSPGLLLKHYAPDIPIRLNAVDVKDGEALLGFGSLKFMGLQNGGFAKDLPEGKLKNLSEEGDLYEAASNLFSYLRELDKPENTAIAVMNIPDKGVGIAINDRLRRAEAAG